MRVFECSSGNPFQKSLCFFVPLGGLRKALVKRVYAINDRVYRGVEGSSALPSPLQAVTLSIY